MKKICYRLRSLGCWIVLCLLSIPALAQYPLDVQVNLAPPYPIRLSDFTAIESNVLVNVQNTGTESHSIALFGTLRNEDTGASITSDASRLRGSCIDILPGTTTMLSGTELRDLFNPDNLIIRGLSREAIRGDEALPEGRYTLCIRAIDCNDVTKFLSEVPTEPFGCSGFDVSYVDPPVIISPVCDITLPAESVFINISWTQVIPTNPGATIDYSIRIVEVEPPTRNPFDAMLTSPPVFETEVSGITVYNLQIPEDVILEAGRKYAIQITAKNDAGEVAFKNDGKSEICVFKFGSALAGSGGLVVTPVYPLDDDVIPFSFFPIIVRYDPYDDQYNNFSYDFSIQNNKGFSDTNTDDLNWGSGPLESQRDATGFREMTQDQAQQIALYKNQSDRGMSGFRFERGAHYNWNADIEIERRGAPITAHVPNTNFKVGMSASILQEPADNDTVPPGDIHFRWQTGQEPVKLMPDYAIVQARHGSPTTFFNGLVDERWVIEVSKSETFTTIVNTLGGRLGYNADLMSDPQVVKDELYKDLEESFNITENGRYYWRVRWMNSPENISDNSSYATSPVWSFVISDSASTTPPVASRDSVATGACVSVCIAEPVTNRTAVSGLTVGTNLIIGKFTMTVRSIESSAGGRFTGEGVVTIPFLNGVKILVDFNGIQYNSESKIFAGTVTAKADREFVSEEMRTTVGSVLSMSETEARNLHGFISDGERLMSAFTGSREIGMPIGIDREIDGHRYVIGIVAMEFTTERATVDALMSLDIPNLGDRMLALGAKDICITPGGLGDEGRLYLARDWVVVQEGETQFAFKGSETADTTRATYVSWDCHGFKCMQVRGEVTFPRSMFVPDNEDGTIGDGHVKGRFGAKACRGGNWIAMIDFDPFQVNGLEGWGWNASNAYLDFSDLENPPDFRLPAGYGDTTLLDSRLINTWQGFYMERIEVRLPPEFASTSSAGGGRITFGAYNTIIDNTGLSVSIQARNILEVSEGNFEGWAFAIDTLNIDFVSNTFTQAGMAGRIGMPIFEAGDNLKYRMALNFDDDHGEFSYQFRVYTRDTLNIPMWGAAQMFFKPNSSIEIGFNDPEKGDHATALLHGGVHLVGDFGAIAGVAFRGINFEGLYLSTSPDEQGRYFKADSLYIAHASPQKSASGFPVNIENINFNINTITRPGLEFDLILNFAEGSTAIGAEARFGVFATFEKVGDEFRVGFGGVDVGRIAIDVEISVMKLEGELQFYRDDPTYGNGTRGNIRVELPMNISGELTAYFGTVGSPQRGRYGTADYFNYWFVDGMITFPGLPIFSGFAIYGFGGGAYHHMTMRESQLPNPQDTRTGSGRTSVVYVPSYTTALGLKFTAVFGTHPSSDAFNMDVRLAAEFNSSFGLNFINIGGEGYFMASITDRGEAKVWAHVDMLFDNREDSGPKFSGNFDVFVRVGDYLYGRGEGYKFVDLEIYADRNTWHVYMGTPEDRAGLIADVRVIRAELTTYLMVGHGIPITLPPLPARIQSVLGGDDLEGGGETSAQANSRTRNPSDETLYRSGQGFAFGTALALDANFDFAIFYASLGLDLGFDLNFSKTTQAICAETGAAPRGIDGWYIQGQVFAGLYGEMGVQVDLFFVKGRFPFIQLAAAAVLQGNFPDPTGFRGRAGLYYSVLGGMVEGRCNFQFDIGQRCTYVTPNPLSGMDFIADMLPQNGGHNESCFTSPAVSFNLPVNKNIEFPSTAVDGSEITRVFYPFIETFTFRRVSARQDVRGTYALDRTKTELRFRLDQMLVGNTNYQMRIVIKSYEIFSDGTRRLVRNNDGSTWMEERYINFTTGPEPDKIPEEQVSYSYPVRNQYYFLKNEVRENKGLIQLLNPVDRIFRRDIDGNIYRYFVRYIPVSGGDTTEIDLTYTTGRTIQLPLPTTLENETMYAIQIVRKLTRRAGRSMMEMAGNPTALGSRAMERLNIRLAGDAGTALIQSQAQRLLPGESVERDERLLYKFYFRTSRFSSLQDKLASASLTATYKNLLIAEAFEVKTRIDEPFDEFEVNGLTKNGIQVMKPLVNLTDPWVDSYHTRLVKPNIYNFHFDYLVALISERFAHLNFPTIPLIESERLPRETINFSSTGTIITGGITEYQIANEARRNSAYGEETSSAVSSALGGSSMMAASGTLNSGMIFQSASMIATTSVPNVQMIYGTSAQVWGDMMVLKRHVARTLAYTVGATYPVRQALQARYPGLFTKANTLIRQNAIDYRYIRGRYSIDMQYQIPTGGRYQTGTKVTKTFSY
ncbi:MAG: hypothetical protein ACOYXT_06120 [Bacteroidota bacterium]